MTLTRLPRHRPRILSAGAVGRTRTTAFWSGSHGFRTLEARFRDPVQTSRHRRPGAARRIWIRRPHLMRWDYQDPKPKIFLLQKKRVSHVHAL